MSQISFTSKGAMLHQTLGKNIQLCLSTSIESSFLSKDLLLLSFGMAHLIAPGMVLQLEKDVLCKFFLCQP